MREIPPPSDQDLEDWAVPFDAYCTAHTAAIGLTPTQATDLHTATDGYVAARALSTDPLTRTRGTIEGKSQAKVNLLAKAREIIRIISAHPGVTNEQRVDMGLNPKDLEPSPVPQPITKPICSVDPDGWLRIVDETLPNKKGKLAGTSGAVIFIQLDGEPPADDQTMKFAMLTTKYRSQIPLPPGSNKKTLYVVARWFNTRGQLGPPSVVASTTVAV